MKIGALRVSSQFCGKVAVPVSQNLRTRCRSIVTEVAERGKGALEKQRIAWDVSRVAFIAIKTRWNVVTVTLNQAFGEPEAVMIGCAGWY